MTSMKAIWGINIVGRRGHDDGVFLKFEVWQVQFPK